MRGAGGPAMLDGPQAGRSERPGIGATAYGCRADWWYPETRPSIDRAADSFAPSSQ